MPTAEERNRTAAAAAMFRLYIYYYTLFLALIYTAAEPAIRRTIAGILVASPVFGAFWVVVVELEPDVVEEDDALVDAVVDGVEVVAGVSVSVSSSPSGCATILAVSTSDVRLVDPFLNSSTVMLILNC